jgi:membrane protease YdiL (CAAX protease family)
MEIPVQLIIFSIPSIIYLIAQIRRGKKLGNVLEHLGLNGCTNSFYIEGIVVAIVVGVSMWPVLRMIPPEVLDDPNVSLSIYEGFSLSPSSFMYAFFREVFYVTLGEEIFFRGFLGGYLVRRFGFKIGNTIQAFVFLLPHLLLLFVSLSFSTVVVVQFLVGWVFGFLRSRSKSIFPSWLSHSMVNVFGALSAMG